MDLTSGKEAIAGSSMNTMLSLDSQLERLTMAMEWMAKDHKDVAKSNQRLTSTLDSLSSRRQKYAHSSKNSLKAEVSFQLLLAMSLWSLAIRSTAMVCEVQAAPDMINRLSQL